VPNAFQECSTSASHGWRIEGIHLPSGKYEVPKSLREEPVLLKTLRDYIQHKPEIAKALALQLGELRAALESSDWFFGHEIVGSSLLITYDDASPPRAPPRVMMIDFAHVNPVETPLTHRKSWEKGNREDGFLLGIDSLEEVFRGLSVPDPGAPTVAPAPAPATP
jgi:1D-myo-inositol-triphosphate 3-kinase